VAPALLPRRYRVRSARRLTAGRFLAPALLLLGLAGGVTAWQLGWLAHLVPEAAAPTRVELILPPRLAPLPPTPAQSSAPLAPAAASNAVPASAQTPQPRVPLPSEAATPALAPAPDPSLIEAGQNGPLPVIGRDGREPWRAYARPFDRADARPRIAILVCGLGLSAASTEAAISQLPGAVTLAFEPYAQLLPQWIGRAREAGHEVLLIVPMEPSDYPLEDPGPYTLLTSLSAEENVARLDWVLSRGTGYVGVVNLLGSRFAAARANLLPVLEELKKRGLLFVDGRVSELSAVLPLAQSMDLAVVVSEETIDADASRDTIDRALSEIEERAKRQDAALGIGYAYPLTLERLALWTKSLEAKGLALAPVSALAAPPGESKRATK
jgi:uncharacterized protein